MDKRGKRRVEKNVREPKKKSTLRFFIKAFLICLAVILIGNYGIEKIGAWHPFMKETKHKKKHMTEQIGEFLPGNEEYYRQFKHADRVNVLMIGVNKGMSDTLMLISFDRKSKQMDMISVPRDTYFERPGYDGLAERKINAAYRNDPMNAAKAVSKVLNDIPINYYAVVDYNGVKKVVDAMGGVPITLDRNMDYEDPYDKPPLKIHLKAGEQVLNGEQAMQFLRYRKGYGDADIGRIKAHHQFMKNAMKQALGLDFPKVAKVALKELDSDIDLKTGMSLATKAARMDKDALNTYTIPFTPQTEAPYYVYPKEEEIRELIDSIYRSNEPKEDETAEE